MQERCMVFLSCAFDIFCFGLGDVFEHFLGVSDSNTLLKLYFPILCGLLCDADNKEINTTGYSE